MKKLLLILMTMVFIPMAYANSGQVAGPLAGLGVQHFDDDNNSGTTALSNYAWLQFDTGAGTYDGDADNDTNLYTTECVMGYFLPIWINLATDEGKLMYETAKSGLLASKMIIINYTQNGAGLCVADDLFIIP